jgi:hypothetical protein
VRNSLHGITRLGVQTVDSVDSLSLGAVYLKPSTAEFQFDGLIAKASPARMKSPQSKPLHTSVSFLSEFAPIDGVNEAMNTDQQFCL